MEKIETRNDVETAPRNAASFGEHGVVARTAGKEGPVWSKNKLPLPPYLTLLMGCFSKDQFSLPCR